MRDIVLDHFKEYCELNSKAEYRFETMNHIQLEFLGLAEDFCSAFMRSRRIRVP